MKFFKHCAPFLSKVSHAFTALSLVALFQASAFAVPVVASGTNWSISLSEADRTGPAGSILTYSGTIGNTTGSDLFIDASTLDFTASAPSSDYNFDLAPKFLDTLGIIGIGGYSGPLFFVEWLNTVVPGTTGLGSFELTVASTGDPAVLSVAFSGTVTASVVPTPGSLPLLFVGFMGIVCLRIKRPNMNIKSKLAVNKYFV